MDHWLDWEASELKVRGEGVGGVDWEACELKVRGFDGSLPCFLIDRY